MLRLLGDVIEQESRNVSKMRHRRDSAQRVVALTHSLTDPVQRPIKDLHRKLIWNKNDWEMIRK